VTEDSISMVTKPPELESRSTFNDCAAGRVGMHAFMR
jgi:hypothetical protein